MSENVTPSTDVSVGAIVNAGASPDVCFSVSGIARDGKRVNTSVGMDVVANVTVTVRMTVRSFNWYGS